jgi:hypothetical protein
LADGAHDVRQKELLGGHVGADRGVHEVAGCKQAKAGGDQPAAVDPSHQQRQQGNHEELGQTVHAITLPIWAAL